MALHIIPSEFCLQNIFLDKSQIVYLLNLLKAIKKYSGNILLVLPEKIYFALKNSKSLFGEYIRSNTQIPCIPITLIECPQGCININLNGLTVSLNYSQFLVSLIDKFGEIPLLYDDKDVDLKFFGCDDLECSFFCKYEHFYTLPRMSLNDLDAAIKVAEENNLQEYLFSRVKIDKNNLEERIYHLICLLDINISRKYQIRCAKSFIEDINKKQISMFGVILSVARMVGFPPVKSSYPHMFSIDWHPDTIRHYKSGKVNYNIYRLDVLDNLKIRGAKGSSGAKRVLFAVTGGTIILLAYTEKHDFPQNIISNRITEYESDVFYIP